MSFCNVGQIDSPPYRKAAVSSVCGAQARLAKSSDTIHIVIVMFEKRLGPRSPDWNSVVVPSAQHTAEAGATAAQQTALSWIAAGHDLAVQSPTHSQPSPTKREACQQLTRITCL